MGSATEVDTKIARLLSLAPAGFAMALHVRFTRPAILLQSYPAQWTEIYSARGYLMLDPTVAWGFENTGSIRWSDLVAGDRNGVLVSAAEYGLRFGLTHATDQGDSRTMASFAHNEREFSAEEVLEIEALVDAIHVETLSSRALDTRTQKLLAKRPLTVTQG